MEMKLSEAIREGAKLTPQTNNSYFHRNIDGTLCACALGAAVIAVVAKDKPLSEISVGTVSIEDILNNFPILYRRLSTKQNKMLGEIPEYVRGRIVEMNDGGKSREEIADWVEALEN